MSEAAIHQQVALRSIVPSDVAFVFSTWLRSYRSAAEKVSAAVYFQFQREAIERMLSRSRVLVACDPETRGHVLSYLVLESIGGVPVLHYAYTKAPFRRLGIAGSLLSAALAGAEFAPQHTHETPAGRKLIKRVGSTWNPYLGGRQP